MTEGSALINIGELSKPATVLVEKISDAIGGLAKPWQIRRVAKAEADADKIKAISNIEIDELQSRAIKRFVEEETIKQKNIENIVAKALPQIEENATPENVENDWIANFFDKSRLISDDEMQDLWSKVLAGEANRPGAYSKRTVNFIGSLDKSDASLFQSLCNFAFFDGTAVRPLIYELNAEIYKKQGINFDALKHLDNIGLLSFEGLGGYSLEPLPKQFRWHYYGKPYNIEMLNFMDNGKNSFKIGHVILSKIGSELAPICGSKKVPGFIEYLIEHWSSSQNLAVSCPMPANRPKPI